MSAHGQSHSWDAKQQGVIYDSWCCSHAAEGTTLDLQGMLGRQQLDAARSQESHDKLNQRWRDHKVTAHTRLHTHTHTQLRRHTHEHESISTLIRMQWHTRQCMSQLLDPAHPRPQSPTHIHMSNTQRVTTTEGTGLKELGCVWMWKRRVGCRLWAADEVWL